LIGNRLALAGAILYLLEWAAIAFLAEQPTDRLGENAGAITEAYSGEARTTALAAGWFSAVLLGRILFVAACERRSDCAAYVGLLWGLILKCDDSCSAPPPWRNDPSSWQWDALGWVGVGGFACSLVFVVCLAAGRKLTASIALASWSLVAVAFLTLFRDSGLTSHAERGWLGLAGVGIVGVAAIALRPPPTRTPLTR
jgi:hypothetical protein